MKEKRWKLRQDYEIEDVERLAGELGVDRVIATLLVERGVRTFEEARRFFRPSLEHLHDPFLMKDMDKAVERIERALRGKERIMVYGDYDVDGTSAVAVVFSFLHSLTDNIDFYIPDREREGYGISFEGINYAKDTGVRLIIALDCGIKAVEQVDYAAEAGIDFIIGDHHLPGDELPKAVAVLDPKRNDCPYPYKELSGCGIGFKIVEAIVEKNYVDTLNRKGMTDAAVSAALSRLDPHSVYLPPVELEASYGLKVINTHPRAGLEAILSCGNVSRATTAAGSIQTAGGSIMPSTTGGYFAKNLTISDLVFLVGPRINAAGRLHSAFDSVRLLLEEDIDKAKLLAKEIDDYNRERKELDTSATETAKQRIEADEHLRSKSSIVLFDENWHKGVVGIVASRLVELYYKPTIIFTRSTDNLYVGSARSAGEFDIHAALEQCADLLEHFGGHKCAAGVSVSPENFDLFCERFEQEVRKGVAPDATVPEIEIDATISFAENITPKFLRILKQFSPFGPENNVPVFLTRNLIDTGYPRVVGAKGVKHLKFAPIPFDERSQSYPAIGFQLGEYFDRVQRGDHFDLVYQLEENHWNGKTEMQLNVKDIRFRD